MGTHIEEKALRREIGNLLPLFTGVGARFTARFLPTHEFEESIEVPLPSAEFKDFLSERLSRIARFTSEFSTEQGQESCSMFVGSGTLNLNPTIVHISVLAETSDKVICSIRALAKEGMIKQDSSKKAVARVKQLLQSV